MPDRPGPEGALVRICRDRVASGPGLLEQPVLDRDVRRQVEPGGQLAAFESAVTRVLAVQARREFALDFEQEEMQFAIIGIAVPDGRYPSQRFRLDPQPGFLGEFARQGLAGAWPRSTRPPNRLHAPPLLTACERLPKRYVSVLMQWMTAQAPGGGVEERRSLAMFARGSLSVRAGYGRTRI